MTRCGRMRICSRTPRLGDISRPARSSTPDGPQDRKSTRLNSSHLGISYAVFCLKKKMARVPGGVTVETTLSMLAPLEAREHPYWIGIRPNPAPDYIVCEETDICQRPTPANTLNV